MLRVLMSTRIWNVGDARGGGTAWLITVCLIERWNEACWGPGAGGTVLVQVSHGGRGRKTFFNSIYNSAALPPVCPCEWRAVVSEKDNATLKGNVFCNTPAGCERQPLWREEAALPGLFFEESRQFVNFVSQRHQLPVTNLNAWTHSLCKHTQIQKTVIFDSNLFFVFHIKRVL